LAYLQTASALGKNLGATEQQQMKEIALQILGTGEFAPSESVDSESLDQRFKKESGWTLEHTGVRCRRYAKGSENVVSMGAAAAREALTRAGVSAAQLDLIIAVGSIPAQAIPCTAVLLQRELGLSDAGIPAFDINATCLGFLAALDLVAQGFATERYKSVLLVASERVSMGLNQSDPLTAGLFGDGSGAIVLGPGSRGSALLGSHFQTFSAGAEYCRVRAGGSLIDLHSDTDAYVDGGFFEMRGRALYKLVAEKLPAFLETLFGRAQVAMDDIDVWVPHQASGHAIEHMRTALGVSPERVVTTLETHGNQVSASLPVALHRGIQRGFIHAGRTVALVGTGAGLSFGGAVLRF
jgi:3-oxoacyl-[acyl-carrier-protein] synthase-3